MDTQPQPAYVSARRVALFDFDKTVIDCSSANLWFALEWREHRMPLSYALKVPLWGIQYSLGIGDLDWIFTDAFKLMKGQNHEEIVARVRTWFDAEVRNRARPGALAAIQKHREAGDLVVVATSSSNYLAAMAQQAFGFEDAICTELKVQNGLLTGDVHSAIGANKARRARDWAAERGLNLADCTFYTDSITDLALLEKVGHPVIVNPDRRLERVALARGWPVLDWGRSSLSARPT